MGTSFCRKDEALFNSEQFDRGRFTSSIIRLASHIWQGTFGNLGMYTAGVPIGLLVDAKGPRPGALFGSASLAAGYFSIYKGMEPYAALQA